MFGKMVLNRIQLSIFYNAIEFKVNVSSKRNFLFGKSGSFG
ncbi:hypothetical protein AsAng_0054770 [Aureispira anguillae]|uniref:Uncharacterized protein n=1 Tax=Aureispira anguillae TaxID=2864201 RepID=A0A916DX48_9BACT|nr:hypothetical protein AsAng_0054770 [Aureispira anguillae]